MLCNLMRWLPLLLILSLFLATSGCNGGDADHSPVPPPTGKTEETLGQQGGTTDNKPTSGAADQGDEKGPKEEPVPGDDTSDPSKPERR